MCRLNVWPWVDDALEDYRQRRVNDQDFAGGLVLLSLARSHRSQVYVMFLLFRVTILVPTHGRKIWNCIRLFLIHMFGSLQRQVVCRRHRNRNIWLWNSYLATFRSDQEFCI